MLIDNVRAPLFSSFLPGLGFARQDREQALKSQAGVSVIANTNQYLELFLVLAITDPIVVIKIVEQDPSEPYANHAR